MKRAKQVTRGKSRDDDLPSFMRSKEPPRTYTYADDVVGQPEASFVPYAMTTKYDKGALIAHPKFGRGVVVAVAAGGARIEVLFEDGTKLLGHKA